MIVMSVQFKTHAHMIDLKIGRVVHGDCLDVMRQMPDESIKLVVTSPPYNRSGGISVTTKSGNKKWPKTGLRKRYDGYDDCMPHAEYVAWQRECLNEMMRLLRPDGAIFYNHKWLTMCGLLQDRSDITHGFPVRQIIIWHRHGGIDFNPTHFLPDYEVLYFIAGPKFRLPPKVSGMGCVWRVRQDFKNPHPAPFPVELASKCVRAAKEGIVLDPFMGSGTTAVAAEMAGLDWIGIEQSAKYVKMAEDRIAKIKKQARLY